MNHSRNKNYSNSPGFVYFNTSSPKDTQDFIAFSDRSSSNYGYGPNYNRHSSNHESPNFYGSPRSGKFNQRNPHRYSSGYNRRSFHSPHNSSWGDKRGRKYFNPRQSCNNAPMMSRDGTRDVSMFYDHTSVMDPWEHLEKELETSERLENVESVEMSEPAQSEEVPVKTVEEDSSSSSNDENSSDSSSSDNKEDKSEEQGTS
ncbi:unnamed protein product [Phyllotreta striolata]|uniref:Uncharacterized protein n=1 Tax=Phyllotreta striolata TaxID=444603 RepID=A0A9N9XX09_PHYSR|nr:unnamed protein product [Phyllotreta striolata]